MKYLDKVTTQLTHYMNYNDFDAIIKEEYGQNYELIADEECNNYSSKTYSVEKEELDKGDLDSLNKFISTGRGLYLSRILLQDLVNKELLPEGEYSIDTSW